jgi:hypothetical protein
MTYCEAERHKVIDSNKGIIINSYKNMINLRLKQFHMNKISHWFYSQIKVSWIIKPVPYFKRMKLNSRLIRFLYKLI